MDRYELVGWLCRFPTNVSKQGQIVSVSGFLAIRKRSGRTAPGMGQEIWTRGGFLSCSCFYLRQKFPRQNQSSHLATNEHFLPNHTSRNDPGAFQKEYKEFSETGEKGVASFFTSTKKLISTLDHFFTKSKNIEKDHVSFFSFVFLRQDIVSYHSVQGKSYKEMQKAVKSLLSGLSDDQKMVVGLIIDIYGISFFPFLNGEKSFCYCCMMLLYQLDV